MRGHAIETLEFEVAFGSEREARAHLDRLGDFMGGRGLAAIGEVFDEFSADDEVLRLEALEIDLAGFTPSDESDAEQQLREAVRRALAEALRGRAGERGAPDGTRAAATPRPASELETIWVHLREGWLPWPAARADAAAFDALAVRVASRHGAEVAARLRVSPQRLELVARLVRQWPAEALEHIVRELSAGRPASATALAAWVGQAATPQRAEALRRLLDGADPAEILRAPEGHAPPDTLGPDASPRGRDLPAEAVADAPGSAPTNEALAALAAEAPDAVRGRVRLAGQDPRWRVAVAASADAAAWRGLLGAWLGAHDAAFVAALLAAPEAWRMGAARTAREVAAVLGEALLAELLQEGRDRLDAERVLVALVSARARLDGLAVARAAQALQAGWRAARRDDAWTPRLEGLVAALVPQDGAPRPPAGETPAPETPGLKTPLATPPAPDAVADDLPSRLALWRLDADHALGEARLDAAAWTALRHFEPGWLVARLRRHGRVAAWRRAFAATLDDDRLVELLALRFEPADARFLAALAATPGPWRLEAQPPAGGPPAMTVTTVELRTWLLAELLTPAQVDLAAAVAGLVARRAARDRLDPGSVARAVATGWPSAGPGGEVDGRLRELIGAAENAEAPRPTAGRVEAAEPPPDGPAVRARLLQAFAQARAAGFEPLLRHALAEDRTWFLPTLRRHADDPALRRALAETLPEALLFELAEPWLTEAAARLILAVRPSGRADWEAILAAIWPTPAPGPAPALPSDAEPPPGARLRQPGSDDPGGRPPHPGPGRSADGDSPDTHLAPFQAADPEDDPTPRLARLLLRTGGRTARRARLAELKAARPYLRDTLPMPDAARAPEPGEPGSASSARSTAAAETPAQVTPAPDPPVAETPVPADPHPVEGQPPTTVAAWIGRLPARPGPVVTRALAALLTPPAAGWRQLQPLSEVRRRALLVLLRGDAARAALRTHDALEAASRAGGLAEPAAGAAAFAWSFLLTELIEEDRRFEPVGFAERWIAARLAEAPDAVHSAWRAALGAGVAALTSDAPSQPPPGAASHARPPAAEDLAPIAAALAALPAADIAAPATPLEPTAWQIPGAAPDTELHVENAGLVLAGPYVPMLFDRLGLTRDGAFVDGAAAERGAHLLQFLVDGGPAQPDHRLVLNKLMCGLDLRTPMGRDFEVTVRERETVESLLTVMIERWSILGNTSIGGLRESFLQRQGALTLGDEAWRLLVEPRAFDMLLDQIPWGFSTLMLPWMAQVLHVDWR